MRQIINISLPSQMGISLEKAVKDGQYATKSEFFRDLFRMWLEGKIVKELAESRRELLLGRGKTLKSLRQLR